MATVRKDKKGWLFLVAVVLAIIVLTTGGKGRKYDKAADYMWEGNYEAAIEIYTELGDYENSRSLLKECRYQQADRLLLQRDYRGALNAFESLGNYSDSDQRILECYLGLAKEASNDEDYEKAISWLLLADGHPEATAKLDEAHYAYGHQLFTEGQYGAAQNQFDQIVQMPENAEPHFQTLQDARAYLNAQADILTETITCFVGQMPEGNPGDSDFDILSNYVSFQSGSVIYNTQTKQLWIKAYYYPGNRILYAWRTGDTSMLSQAELEAMAVAEQVVKEAAEYSDPWTQELYIYNWLCSHVEYESPNMDVDNETYKGLRQLTCLGSLLDGKANCQGYTDGFYLLANMLGMDVGRIRGDGEGEGHIWNSIMLDGKRYIVDVTFGDADNISKNAKTYTWFNCKYDPETYTIDGGAESIPDLVWEDDLSKGYYTRKNAVFTNLNDATYYLLRQYKKNGKGFTYAVVDGQEIPQENIKSSLKKNYKKAGVKSYSCTWMVETYGGDSYIIIQWK